VIDYPALMVFDSAQVQDTDKETNDDQGKQQNTPDTDKEVQDDRVGINQ
jgi:hypothetical protein